MPDLPGPWRAVLDECRLYPAPHDSRPIPDVWTLDAATAAVAGVDARVVADREG